MVMVCLLPILITIWRLSDPCVESFDRHGVSIQDIQAQGTWSSDAVWRYIQLLPSATSAVSSAFTSHLYA